MHQSIDSSGGIERDWKDARGMCLPVLVILPIAASPSVQLIGIQSRVGSMRERVEEGVMSVSSNTQPSLLAGN